MTVINNATLILKDSQGNKGVVKSFTDNDINKISNAITDVGQVVDPATHMPIEATTSSVGVVQLATAQDITNGTAGKVVDAQELINFAQTLPAANGVTDVSSGDNSNQLVVSKFGGNKTLTIDNVEHADSANQATHAAHAATATTSDTAKYLNDVPEVVYGVNGLKYFNVITSTTSGAKNVANPTNTWFHHLMMNHRNSDGYYFDIACAFGANTIYYRRVTKGTETSWVRLIDSDNIGSQSVNYANSAGAVAWNNVSGKPSSYTPSSHTHDDRYYTESEINTKLSALLLQIYPVGSIYISANSTNPGTLFGGTWKALDQGRVLIGANSTYKAGTTGGEFTHTITTSEMPSHTHTGTTGNESAGHTHSGTTGNQSAGHTHSWSGTTSSDGSHAHTASSNSTGSHSHSLGGRVHSFAGVEQNNASHNGERGAYNFYGMGNDTTNSAGAHSHTITVNSNGAHTHTVSGTTGGISANHTHSFTTGGISAHHNHGFTTGASGSGSAMNNMQPYLAVYMWQRTA